MLSDAGSEKIITSVFVLHDCLKFFMSFSRVKLSIRLKNNSLSIY